MRFWLVKEEPASCSFEQFAQKSVGRWDGIRKFQARNNLRSMTVGDFVLWYATGSVKAMLGTAQVTREAYPEPTAENGDWAAVDLRPGKALPKPVPLTALEHRRILELGGTK